MVYLPPMKTTVITAVAALAALAFQRPLLAGAELAGIAARSVHLNYERPAPGDVSAIECAVTVRETAPGTFFEVAGFECGYCGFQELYDGSHVFIFSVWDPGDPFDFKARPDAVPPDRRVKEVYAAAGVRVKRFGGEGTGAQAMAPYDWKKDVPETVRISCSPDGADRTEFTAWIKTPSGEWRRMASFSTLHLGTKPFSRAFSFIEDFRRNRASAGMRRRADFIGMVFTFAGGERRDCAQARFTADSNPSLAIDAAPVPGGWTLATGGSVTNSNVRLGGTVARGAPGEASK